MAISPAQFKAFAGKGKQDPMDDDDAEHEAAESEEFEAGEEEGAAEAAAEPEEEEEPEEEAAEGEEGEEEVNVQEIGDAVQDGKGDPKLLELAADLTDEDKEVPPPWAVDADIWEHAVSATEEFWDEYDAPFAVVVHVYDAMGGEID